MATVGFAVLLLLGTAHAKSAVQEGTANQRAMTWLRDNGSDPDAAGMADLRASDPNAFAIVQALLTKRSLGLLDPSNPSASFTGAKHQQQRSFKQEADEHGLTVDAPVSDSSPAVSNVPYPSVGAAALPFPDVAAPRSDSHFNFHANNDDAMVQSVLGAVSQLKQHGSAFATKKSTTHSSALSDSPISIDWGNPHAGVDQPVPSHQSLVVSQSKSTDQSSMGLNSALTADANALGEELVVQDENAHNSVASASHHAPIVPPSLNWANPHEGADAQTAQMSMGQQNSYLAATPLTADRSQDPVANMEQSSFHKLADSFRKFSQASMSQSRSQVAQAAPQDFGATYMSATYKKDLKAAKDDQWKMALESTEWGRSSAPAKAIAQVQEAFDDSDGVDPVEEERVRQQKVQKFLGTPAKYARYTGAKTMMTQESEDDEDDNGAKFAAWIGSKKAKDLEKSYDNVMPQNQYMKDYMADLTH